MSLEANTSWTATYTPHEPCCTLARGCGVATTGGIEGGMYYTHKHLFRDLLWCSFKSTAQQNTTHTTQIQVTMFRRRDGKPKASLLSFTTFLCCVLCCVVHRDGIVSPWLMANSQASVLYLLSTLTPSQIHTHTHAHAHTRYHIRQTAVSICMWSQGSIRPCIIITPKKEATRRRWGLQSTYAMLSFIMSCKRFRVICKVGAVRWFGFYLI